MSAARPGHSGLRTPSQLHAPTCIALKECESCKPLQPQPLKAQWNTLSLSHVFLDRQQELLKPDPTWRKWRVISQKLDGRPRLNLNFGICPLHSCHKLLLLGICQLLARPRPTSATAEVSTIPTEGNLSTSLGTMPTRMAIGSQLSNRVISGQPQSAPGKKECSAVSMRPYRQAIAATVWASTSLSLRPGFFGSGRSALVLYLDGITKDTTYLFERKRKTQARDLLHFQMAEVRLSTFLCVLPENVSSLAANFL